MTLRRSVTWAVALFVSLTTASAGDEAPVAGPSFSLVLDTPATLATQAGPLALQPPLVEALIRTLPPHLRDQGRAVLAEPDEARRGDLAEALAKLDAAATLDFLLRLLDIDPSATVREEIVDELEDNPDGRVTAALQKRVLTDPDTDIVIAALELLRARAVLPLQQMLAKRIQQARASGNAEQLRLLAAEHERWGSIVRGALVPTFMQTPPPLFSVRRHDAPVRVLAFGDFGDGSESQRLVAGAMLQYHRLSPFDFAITLGDNFYSKGMESPADPRWRTWWNELYDPLGIHFYASLGNHDWNGPNGPAAEILYSRESPSWRLPATYYTFTAGPTQFFALDTDIISEAQLIWLVEELDRSTAKWKIVYGHHPIYSEGQHEDNNLKIEQLLPVLKDRADVYIAGHDHDMQHLEPEGRLHFFVAGSGGKLRPITPGPRSLFAKSAHGFAVLDITGEGVKVSFVGTDLQVLYEYTVKKATTSSQ